MNYRRIILPLMLVVLFMAVVAYGVSLATRPEKTPSQVMAENPRFTFRVACKVRSLTPMIQEFNLAKDENGKMIDGRPAVKDGVEKNPRKYSLTCNIDNPGDVLALDPKIPNSVPVMKAGDHSFTLLQDSALTMINMKEGELHIKYPVNSQGLLIYELPLYDWVDDYKVNLFCWEDIGSSGNPEHVCQLF